VTVEISPEPTPEEREALLRALGQLSGGEDAPDPWWLAGIREATEDDQDDS
jgi:hypothetical protein